MIVLNAVSTAPDTSVYRPLQQIDPSAAILALERTLILSRKQAGWLAFGRPRKMQPDQQELARELVRDGESTSAVTRTFNLHPATIYRVLDR